MLRHFAVRFADGDLVEVETHSDAARLRDRCPGSGPVIMTRHTGRWREYTRPRFPGTSGYHDPQPDRYEAGSQFPDRGAIAGISGISNSTRRVVRHVLDELAHDVSELADPDTIRAVIETRAATIGAPRP